MTQILALFEHAEVIHLSTMMGKWALYLCLYALGT